MQIIALQILKLLLLVLVGVLVKKKNIIPEEGTNILAKLLINVTLPILTFFSITSYRLPSNIVADGFYIIVFAILIQLLNLGLGKYLSKKLHLNDLRKNVYAAQMMIGNTVYLAFPLMTALYGETGLIYAIIYYLVSLSFIWTIGIYLFNKHDIKGFHHIFRSLINPCTVAFLLGVLALVLRIDLLMDQFEWFANGYDFFYDTFYPLGSSTMSISMVFIGMIVGKYSLRDLGVIFRQKQMILLLVFKMLLVPVLVMGLLKVTMGWVSIVAINVVFIEALMPASTITVAIAKENGSDYEYAMEIAIATTVVCMISIPFMLQVFNWFI